MINGWVKTILFFPVPVLPLKCYITIVFLIPKQFRVTDRSGRKRIWGSGVRRVYTFCLHSLTRGTILKKHMTICTIQWYTLYLCKICVKLLCRFHIFNVAWSSVSKNCLSPKYLLKLHLFFLGSLFLLVYAMVFITVLLEIF